VARVAETLRITDLLDRKPAALSGGQRQHVAIGRALVRDPKVFLLDEPLSNLDAKLRTETRTEIKRLHQALGRTMVYVTHDQIEAMTLATRIAVLNGGRIEQLGTPEEVYHRPASLFVAAFVGSPGMNLLPGRVVGGRFISARGMDPVSMPADVAHLAEGQPVTLGIRPESIAPARPGEPGVLAAQVEVVELTGPEKLVQLAMGGDRVTASFPPTAAAQPGQRQAVTFDAGATIVFDTATGRRIDPGA
jgi:multiple sugar transport system ATP-binding protein